MIALIWAGCRGFRSLFGFLRGGQSLKEQQLLGAFPLLAGCWSASFRPDCFRMCKASARVPFTTKHFVSPVIVNWRSLCPSRTFDTIWTYFLLAKLEWVTSGISWVEAREAAKHPTMHRMAPPTRITPKCP